MCLSQNKFIEAWQRQTPPPQVFTDIFRVKNRRPSKRCQHLQFPCISSKNL